VNVDENDLSIRKILLEFWMRNQNEGINQYDLERERERERERENARKPLIYPMEKEEKVLKI
jgi:hypothetical protein